jgi:hypothetical protein
MKPEELEKGLMEIRKDASPTSYLNPFRAQQHIKFLLTLCEEMATTLGKIQALLNKEV